MTSTTNMTGFLASSRGFIFRTAGPSAPRSSFGSKMPRLRGPPAAPRLAVFAGHAAGAAGGVDDGEREELAAEAAGDCEGHQKSLPALLRS